MPPSPTPPAFSHSLEAFKRELSSQPRHQGDIEAFEWATIEELRNAIDHIQREQAHRRGYRNLNKIRPFLACLQQYARVIEVFVSAKPDFLAFIWVSKIRYNIYRPRPNTLLHNLKGSADAIKGPIKLCLQVASRLTDAFDCLLDAYARIGESLPIFAAVDTLFSARGEDHVQQILANVYEDILKFHGRAVSFFKQRSMNYFICLDYVLIVIQHGQ